MATTLETSVENLQDPNYRPVYKGGTVPIMVPKEDLRQPDEDDVLANHRSPVILYGPPPRKA